MSHPFTDVELIDLELHWKKFRSLESWTHWERYEKEIAARFPVLIKANNHYKLAQKTIDAAFNKVYKDPSLKDQLP